MDTEKLIEVFNDITRTLTSNDASIGDVAQVGYSLIVSAWKNDPDKEDIIDKYIKWFEDNFRKSTDEILEEEKEKKE